VEQKLKPYSHIIYEDGIKSFFRTDMNHAWWANLNWLLQLLRMLLMPNGI